MGGDEHHRIRNVNLARRDKEQTGTEHDYRATVREVADGQPLGEYGHYQSEQDHYYRERPQIGPADGRVFLTVLSFGCSAFRAVRNTRIVSTERSCCEITDC